MVAVGIISLVLFLAVCAIGYFIYEKKIRDEAAEKLHNLQIQNDTANILLEHKIGEVDKAWEEYDKQQWEKRFGGEIK